MTEETTQGITPVDDLQREQELNLVGFSTVRKVLALLPPIDRDNIKQSEDIARSVMNVTLAEYFAENEGQYLDPDTRKYIIAGATMAYAYWHAQVDIDNGEQNNE